MQIAIISDIHSNIEALDTALGWIEDQGIDEVICLGDVVGYGADPNVCCERIRERCRVTLMGNHDAAVVGVMDTDYYYDAAREAIAWTRARLSAENFEWLYGLPYSHVLDQAGFFHAAPIRPSRFFYVVQTGDAQAHTAIYEKLRPWNFVGHSHLTNCYKITGRRATDVTGTEMKAGAKRKHLINVGSVGQPRDRDPRLCFGLFDVEAGTFEHIRLKYDISSAAEKISNSDLDEKFAQRLFLGQ